jgi:ABC-type sugar transport system permease subunit
MMAYETKKAWAGLLFILPWLVGFVYFFFIPFIYSFVFSIYEVKPDVGGMNFVKFIGLKNYVDAFTTDIQIVKGLPFTLQAMAWQIPLILVFSTFLAVLLNAEFRGRMFVRGIFFLPVIIASGVIINILKNDNVATSMMMGSRSSTLFQGIQFSSMLLQLGLPVSVTDFLMQIINGIFELVWKSGVQTVLLLAGLQAVPRTVYESAAIEGATAWETFWKITVPMVSPILLLCAFYTIMDNSTDYSNITILYIRETARALKLGYAAAIANIWFAIIMVIVGVVFFLTRNKVYYMDDKG